MCVDCVEKQVNVCCVESNILIIIIIIITMAENKMRPSLKRCYHSEAQLYVSFPA